MEKEIKYRLTRMDIFNLLLIMGGMLYLWIVYGPQNIWQVLFGIIITGGGLIFITGLLMGCNMVMDKDKQNGDIENDE